MVHVSVFPVTHYVVFPVCESNPSAEDQVAHPVPEENEDPCQAMVTGWWGLYYSLYIDFLTNLLTLYVPNTQFRYAMLF